MKDPQESNGIQMRGCLEVALLDARNNGVLRYRQVRNTVVTRGRQWALVAIQSGNAATAQTIQQVAVGTDTTAPTTADTALGSESDRIAIGTWDNAGTTANPPYWRATAQFATNEANTTLGEVGLFNSSSAGTMLAHATFSTVDKTTSNTLGVTYTISN